MHCKLFARAHSRVNLLLCVQGLGKRKLLHVPKYDKWDNVFLEYRVDWPLHLLLTPQVQQFFSHSVIVCCLLFVP